MTPDQLRHAAEHFADALPEDAMLMSSIGEAEGYDYLRFGIKWAREGKTPNKPVAQANAEGVYLLVWSDAQRAWIDEAGEDLKRRATRKEVVRLQNFSKWEELHPSNLDYLHSLLWIPVSPLSAMEIIARMSAD